MKIEFIGHYKEGSHDKIWGYLNESDDSFLSFWGRSNGTMSFKRHSEKYYDRYQLVKKSEEKERKGYRECYKDEYNLVLPSDFEGQVLLARLGQIKFE